MTTTFNRNLFIRLYMWQNQSQNYLPVGTLVYDNDPSQRLGFVGFSYDRDYVSSEMPAVDPAHLDPQIDGGRFAYRARNGKVPPYFSGFLPGEFGQQLLNDVDERWGKLTEAEKLVMVTYAHGDFGAPQLNPQNDQHNVPICDFSELSRLVQALRDFQYGKRPSPITRHLQGALCSFRGPKPKVDYEEESDGVIRRFVAKLITTSSYNDARVAATFTSLETNAGINACANRVVSLDSGEDVLFCENYARTESFDGLENETPSRLILKYNRVSFETLLADDPVLGNTQRPNYKHIAYAIDKYSSNPVSDKEELYCRAVLSAATNHTSNGLENMEMYDGGMGKWRLSPSFQNLPNPMTDAQFDVGFNDSIMTGNLLSLDEQFLVALGFQVGIEPSQALGLALSVTESLIDLENVMAKHALCANDRNTLRECVKVEDISALHCRLKNDEKIQRAVAGSTEMPNLTPNNEVEAPGRGGPTI